MPEGDLDPFARTALSDRPPATDPLAATHDASGDRTRGLEAGAEPDHLIGTRLAHFRIDAPLGSGGMGTVYRGWDTALERPVAIKVLALQHEQARQRFLREARAQAKVRHPNVVPIHFVGQQGEVVFLSMDIVEGESVAERLEGGQPIPVSEALDMIDAVAQALAEGNASGLIHRDVKPSNVLLAKDGRVLLADFGLAKTVGTIDEVALQAPTSASNPVLTQQGALVGTPAYMAPEQTRTGPIDHRADMYALGVTLYEMVTCQRPFTASNTAELLLAHREREPRPPRQVVSDLPPAVDALIVRLLSKDPSARYETYEELRAAIYGARARSVTSGGFFARASAVAIDFMIGGVVALVFSFIHPLVSWPAVTLLWSISEWRWAKTPGKRLFRLGVVGPHDEPPKLRHALGRNVVKYWGPVLMAVSELERWESSRIASVITLVIFALWTLGMCLGAGKKKLALHDRLAGTRVVYDLLPTPGGTSGAKVS